MKKELTKKESSLGVLESWLLEELEIKDPIEQKQIAKEVLYTFGEESLFHISTAFYKNRYETLIQKLQPF